MSDMDRAKGSMTGRWWGSGAIVLVLTLAIAFAMIHDSDGPRAERFVLAGGEEITGSIVQATRNAVVLRREIGGARQVSMAEIGEVQIELTDGATVAGQLLDWSDGVYVLQSGESLVRIRDGAILENEAITEPVEEPAMPAVADLAEPAEESAVGVGGPITELPTGSDAPATPGAPSPVVVIEASVEPVAEDAATVVLKVKLSPPPQQPLAVIYVTVDGTATSGEDYEPAQGVMTLTPGSTEAELQMPLIDDALAEGDEHFKLFLSVDPKMAELRTAAIVATIQDDDS